MSEPTTTTESDLRIDAFEYARKYRELKELGEKIKSAVEDTKGLHLGDLVFYDGLEHFQLYSVYSSDDLLKVKSLECVDAPQS